MTGKKTDRANAIKEEEVTASLIKTVTAFVMKEKAASDLKGAIEEEEMETINKSKLRYYIRTIPPVLVLLLMLFPSKSYSQFGLSTGLNMSYNDNINSNYEYLPDEITEFFLEGSYNIPSRNKSIEFYYSGSYNYFRRNISRTFHEHTAGFSYSNSFSKKSNSALNLGSSFKMSLNRDDYSYLDFSNANAFANFRTYTGKRTLWQIGYNFDYFIYNDFSDFNNLQNYVYTSFTGFLPSRTALTFETGFGAKSYLNSLSTSTTMGQGKHNMSSSSIFNETIMRVDVSGKLTQTILDNTGFSISGGYTKNLKSDDRYLISGNVTGSDNIFDDEYSFEGPFVESSLTQRFPWGISASLGGIYRHRIFIDRPAYDLEENIISSERIDDEFTASFSLMKNFNYFGIRLVYNYINNSTNDRYYNFNNNVFSVEIGAGF